MMPPPSPVSAPRRPPPNEPAPTSRVNVRVVIATKCDAAGRLKLGRLNFGHPEERMTRDLDHGETHPPRPRSLAPLRMTDKSWRARRGPHFALVRRSLRRIIVTRAFKNS